jgi:ribose/xylose/arabinose/galactoside ABC-type transport system permease subunit
MASVPAANSNAGFFAREGTIAGPGYNRWWVVPAALAIHLCIGMAYGFSVFWLPMTKLVATAEHATSHPRSS